ncbi:MAG: LuxR C-terminal-related transcriptional regulator [Nitriliruptorales bacterium]
MLPKASPVVPVPTLTVRNGALAGTVLRLDEEHATLGRRADNTYTIDDPRVSRVHASIRRQAGSFVLTPLGGSATTKVNGEAITGSAVLRHGDVTHLGPIELVFEDPSDMASPDESTMVFDIARIATGPNLSPRQQQVLEGMADGLTNKEIGERLGVTERTVKAYAQELYDKLGVNKRASAVAEGMKLGLLDH